MHIDSWYLDLLNACILKLVYLTIEMQIFSLNWMMQTSGFLMSARPRRPKGFQENLHLKRNKESLHLMFFCQYVKNTFKPLSCYLKVCSFWCTNGDLKLISYAYGIVHDASNAEGVVSLNHSLKVNSFKSSVLFVGHRQRVETQTRRRRVRRLIRVLTVCLHNVLSLFE